MLTSIPPHRSYRKSSLSKIITRAVALAPLAVCLACGTSDPTKSSSAASATATTTDTAPATTTGAVTTPAPPVSPPTTPTTPATPSVPAVTPTTPTVPATTPSPVTPPPPNPPPTPTGPRPTTEDPTSDLPTVPAESSEDVSSTPPDVTSEPPVTTDPPAACPTPALAAGDTTRTLTVGGKSRTYVLHVPAAYDATKATPFVVDFHPLGGSGPSERSGSPYPAQTDPEGVIMAFPSGLSGPSGGAWNVGPCCVADVDDVAFARALVDDVKSIACVDEKRVYAVGFSMGGGMSHYIACHAADVFAAVAPAAFDLLEENIGDCKPARPITVISFRGTGDPIVKYEGGGSSVVTGMPVTFLGAKDTFDAWSEMNGCTDAASAEDANGCTGHKTCDDGVEVMLCTKQGGGHEAGNAKVAWPILKQHILP